MDQAKETASTIASWADSRKRVMTTYEYLNKIVIGHDEMVRGLFLGLIAREHVAFIGAPGTAKSYTVHNLAMLVDAKFYRYLLTKFTDYSELFGSVDINSLANGEYRRNWSDIINADIVFLDEIFKANSAILNSLLSMMQERAIYDPMTGRPRDVSLWTLVGASNEVPSDEELQALYDRFSVRVFVDYLSDDASILKAIETRWAMQGSDEITLRHIATMEDVKILHNLATKLIVSKVKQLGEPLYKVYHLNAVPLVKSMRSKGVIVSDRTVIEKLPKLYASYITLFGLKMDNVMNAVYDILPYLAHDKSQLRDIKKVIEEGLGEVAELSKGLEEAKQKIRTGDLKGALEKLEDIMNFDVEKIKSRPWLRPRAEMIMSSAREYHRLVQSQLRSLEKLAQGEGL